MIKIGLDMYLDATKYLSPYGKVNDSKVSVKVRGQTFKVGNGSSIGEAGRLKGIRCTAIYWRKANAIHKWFVDNIQEGNDECEPHRVSHDKLIVLKELCEKVLKYRSQAKELLPTQEGFFFGTYEQDEWYWDSLTQTVEEIKTVLKMFPEDDGWELEYCSSW